MDRRDFLYAMAATPLAARLGHAGTGPGHVAAVPPGVPALEQLAGQWRAATDLHAIPSVSSVLGAAQVGRDLVSVEQLTFPPLCQGGGSGALLVDGVPLQAATFRWYPWQVMRRARVYEGDVALVSTTRLSGQTPTVLCELTIENHGRTRREVALQLHLHGMVRARRHGWNWNVPRPERPADFTAAIAGTPPVLLVGDSRSAAGVAFGFSALQPQRLVAFGDGGAAYWHVALEPRHSATVNIVMHCGAPVGALAAQCRAAAAAFSHRFQQCRDEWQATFSGAFQAGNTLFSGRLPVLQTADPEMHRVYYMSVASLLAMLRRGLGVARRAYVTGSPDCAASLMYFWDTSTWQTLHALLDPANMKRMLLRWLELNIHGCYAQDMLSGTGVGPWYSFNDFVVFQQFTTYINVTGDHAFLHEKAAGRTVIDQLEEMALWWKRLVPRGGALADYGNASNLLECVPTYTHAVASLNAANVWMMRQAAAWRDQLGHRGRAASLRAQARALSRQVLGLYVRGGGYWNTLHPGNQQIPVRHCVDFFTVAHCMPEDLSPAMRREMVRFVRTQLLTDHWMRALSLQDAAAAESNRPDHGPMGAYDAWPPYTAEGLCTLGHGRLALDFLRRCAATTREGPYGQSHELLTTRRDAPVRKASRGGQMYNCSCSGAFAEVIIRTVFGFRGASKGGVNLFLPHLNRGFTGTLAGVAQPSGGALAIRSGPKGLTAVMGE